jgi:hypothetical protein
MGTGNYKVARRDLLRHREKKTTFSGIEGKIDSFDTG